MDTCFWPQRDGRQDQATLLVSAYVSIIGVYPVGLLIAGTVWGLFELPIAAVAGAWFYQEGAAA